MNWHVADVVVGDVLNSQFFVAAENEVPVAAMKQTVNSAGDDVSAPHWPPRAFYVASHQRNSLEGLPWLCYSP